jgi:hypothetical protein
MVATMDARGIDLVSGYQCNKRSGGGGQQRDSGR